MLFFRLPSLPLLLCALTGFLALSVNSAPAVARRQIGDIQCNVDRLATVAGLGESIAAVSKLSSAGSSDATVTSAASTAQTGLSSAKSGIETIAAALLTGQTAPAAARTQVENGLQAAQTALNGVNSTDPTVTSALSSAQSALAKTQTAGQGVVSNCN